jgi:hypothetical protein
MVTAQVLLGDDHALVGDAGTPGVFQDHRWRLPVAPGLHAIHRRRIAQRVVGEVNAAGRAAITPRDPPAGPAHARGRRGHSG